MRKVENKIARLDQIRTPNHVLELLPFLSSTYQLKIFLLIIQNLREFGEIEYVNYQAGQKALLAQDVLSLSIPLSEISKPSEYRDVKKVFIEMSQILCEIKFKERGENKIWSGSLFSVSIPANPNYSSIVKINMDVVVARLFINFYRNEKREPIFYSKINTDIRMVTKLKNVIKLYLYLCLWRNVHQLNKSIKEVCDTLGLPKAYHLPHNFKKHLLEVSYPILKSFGDVWFEMNDIKIKKNKKNEYVLDCKIYTREKVEIEEHKKNSIINILKQHFNFKDRDIDEISTIITSTSTKALSDKILYISENLNGVINKAEYVKKALTNEFK